MKFILLTSLFVFISCSYNKDIFGKKVHLNKRVKNILTVEKIVIDTISLNGIYELTVFDNKNQDTLKTSILLHKHKIYLNPPQKIVKWRLKKKPVNSEFIFYRELTIKENYLMNTYMLGSGFPNI